MGYLPQFKNDLFVSYPYRKPRDLVDRRVIPNDAFERIKGKIVAGKQKP